MKLFVSSGYAHLEEFINKIPLSDYHRDKVICKTRNTVEKVTAPDGTQLVVKRYKRPTIANQFVYTFLRWSKPKRSYKFACRLAEQGIETAEPIAYIEIFKYGIFHTGYYITRFVTDQLMSDIDNFSLSEREVILHEFAQYTAYIHSKGIKHGDYNMGNVFFRREGDHYHFSLIDINRMQFRRRLSRRTCGKEIKSLSTRRDIVTVAERYALIRNWNVDLFCGTIFMDRAINLTRRFKKILHFVIRPFVRPQTR
ncbi:MAG: lipopolysaccharide kinase InaA family protein [Bacteroidales bacterium]|jgi:tRNA A-37 threonylcarbamoyl transferase component Bud32|nr:lipopolysaccharide kinase InaA family protein [Bacteroidales bacterium]